MIKNLVYLATVLLICSSCVSRTTYKESSMKGGQKMEETRTVWFWDKDF